MFLIDISNVWPEWDIIQLLGEGSFGKVYKAKRAEFGKEFYSAIKIIKIPQNEQEIKQARTQGMSEASIKSYFKGFVEELINEVSLMNSLKGTKNIVGIEDYKIVEDIGKIGWTIYIRMELLTPFYEYFNETGYMQRDVVKLGMDICEALENCAKLKIIHRDIKPENIFISSFGEFKLGDFGIARQLEKTTSGLSKKGTYHYMAPEVYKGESYNLTVDIYSLGIVMYRLLNNHRLPFMPPYPQDITFQNNEESLARRMSGERFPLPVNASEELANIVLKACAFSSELRYSSPTQMKADLTEVLKIIQNNSHKIQPDVNLLGDPGIPANYKDKLKKQTINISADLNESDNILENTVSIFDSKVDKYENVYNNLDTESTMVLTADFINNGNFTDEKIYEDVYSKNDNIGSTYSGAKKQKKKSKLVIGITLTIVLIIGLVIVMLIGLFRQNEKSKTDDTTIPITDEQATSEQSTSEQSTSEPVYGAPIFSEAYSSSFLAPQRDNLYTAAMAVDGNIKTSWVEGANGDGIGEWIEAKSNETQKVSGMRIVIGFNKTKDDYTANNRPKDIEIVFDDGSNIERTLDDDYAQYQKITFEKPVLTKSIKIIIDSVYSGTRFTDTCIGEIEFY